MSAVSEFIQNAYMTFNFLSYFKDSKNYTFLEMECSYPTFNLLFIYILNLHMSVYPSREMTDLLVCGELPFVY